MADNVSYYTPRQLYAEARSVLKGTGRKYKSHRIAIRSTGTTLQVTFLEDGQEQTASVAL